MLLPKDYVRLRLTGEHAIDAADASGTLLFDVRRREWSGEVLDALELPAEWLPPVHESTAIGGAGDQAAGALGLGVDRPGPLSVVLGTSGVVFAALPEYRPDVQARLHVFCHAVPGTWHAMGVMLSAAGSLRWLRDSVVGESYDELNHEAARWPAGVEGLLFQPYLAGERTPHADPNARGAFVGLSLRHDRGALVRAVLEGVAYGLRDSLELVRELGVQAEVGRVSGGGARSSLWLRIVASVLGLPLERTAASEDGAAFGAALLGGVASGAFADAAEAVAACVHVTDRIEPEPAWQDVVRRRICTVPSSSTRHYDHWRDHELARTGRSRSSPVRAAASAPPSHARSQRTGRSSASPRAAATISASTPWRCRATSATRTSSSRSPTRPPSATGGSTSSSRTQASARTARSSTSAANSSTR